MNLTDVFKILILLLINSNIFSQSYNYEGNIVGIPGIHKVNKISTIYNAEKISGEYLLILGKGNKKITNPYIIVEGIDFLNNQDFDSHLKLYNNGNKSNTNLNNSLVYNLYINGYDVIFLDFDNATDFLQKNAMLLVELINSLELQKNNLVVMGYSMGGLVARYALTWMESVGQNHHTRLYISHDSPHKGANFPLGIQELLDIMRDNTGIYSFVFDMLKITFETNMPAARQMLVYHYLNSYDGKARPSNDKISFFEELFQLNPESNGYPTIPLKIAISNGNYNGIGQGFSDGEELLSFEYWGAHNGSMKICERTLWQVIWGKKGKCNTLDFGTDHFTVNVRAGFNHPYPLAKFSIFSLGKQSFGKTGRKLLMPGGMGECYFYDSNYSYDNVSGSRSPYFFSMLKESIIDNLTTNVDVEPNFCFIPTISALDLNIDLNEKFDLNNVRCKTSFDYIYANSKENSNHFELTPDANKFIMAYVLNNELPKKRVIYDTFNKQIHSKTITLYNKPYNVIAGNTIYNIGDFIIEDGAKSTLSAANNIVLKPGFIAKKGSYFEAIINNTDLMCDSHVEFMPHYINSLKSGNALGNFTIDYDCSNYFNNPYYNSDSLYLDCFESEINEFTSEDIIVFLDTNIFIYPNPTDGQICIKFSNEIELNNLKLEILNNMGNIVYSEPSITSNIINVNLANIQSGILTIRINFNKGNYIYTRKIFKR